MDFKSKFYPNEIIKVTGHIATLILSCKRLLALSGGSNSEENLKSYQYSYNRRPDENRINDIICYQEEHIKTYGYYDYEPIIIASILGNDPKIINGMHRFTSMTYFNDPPEDIIVIWYDFHDDTERFKQFRNSNNSIQLPDLYKDMNSFKQIICKEIMEKLLVMFPIANFDGNIGQEKFFEYLDILVSVKIFEYHEDIEKIIQKIFAVIYNYNTFLSTQNGNYFPEYSLDETKCVACKSQNDWVQCPNPKSRGDRCGKHANAKTPNASNKVIRKELHKISKTTGCYLTMFSNYSWILKLIEWHRSTILINL